MELIKNHYEKIILSLVLAALAVAAGYLPIEVSNVRQSLQEATRSYERPWRVCDIRSVLPLRLRDTIFLTPSAGSKAPTA